MPHFMLSHHLKRPCLTPEWEANSGRRILPFPFQTSCMHAHTPHIWKNFIFKTSMWVTWTTKIIKIIPIFGVIPTSNWGLSKKLRKEPEDQCFSHHNYRHDDSCQTVSWQCQVALVPLSHWRASSFIAQHLFQRPEKGADLNVLQFSSKFLQHFSNCANTQEAMREYCSCQRQIQKWHLGE